MTIDPGQLAIAMTGAIILVAVIIVIAILIHFYKKNQSKEGQESSDDEKKDLLKSTYLFWVIADKNGHGSLSKFQFLLWTVLIAVLYITLWFLQFLYGETAAPPAIPVQVMGLMGISIAVPIANQAIINYKINKYRPEGEKFNEPVFASMLEEEGKPSLLRLQMFLWTLASIVIYFIYFITKALSIDAVPGELALPDIDPTLLYLMGLSQTGYLANAAYSGTVEKDKKTGEGTTGRSIQTTQKDQKLALEISETIPNIIRPKEILTIVGSGFGFKTDTLMLGNQKIEGNKIQRWDNSRIEFEIPENFNPGTYPVRIIAGGNSFEKIINISGEEWFKREGIELVPAEIISEIWIDDPGNKGYKKPPIGYFIPNKRYSFFFEFEVPPGTGAWDTKFTAGFYIDGIKTGEKGKFLPGHLNGKNYGVFQHKFPKNGTYNIEIRGLTTKTMTIHVGPPESEETEK